MVLKQKDHYCPGPSYSSWVLPYYIVLLYAAQKETKMQIMIVLDTCIHWCYSRLCLELAHMEVDQNDGLL